MQTDVSGWAYFPNITAGIYEIDGLADSHSGADVVMSVVGPQALQLLLPYQPVQACTHALMTLHAARHVSQVIGRVLGREAVSRWIIGLRPDNRPLRHRAVCKPDNEHITSARHCRYPCTIYARVTRLMLACR